MKQEILIVAGEASADMHAAHLVQELKSLIPDAQYFGVGGRALAAEGMEILIPSSDLNVVGLADWREKLASVFAKFKALKKETSRRKPVLAVLLDLPDFNLKLSKHLKKIGVPVVYYISPQVWAWRRYRVRTIRKNIERMLVLFPFEKAFYEAHGVDAHFVGHPILENVESRTAHRSQDEVVRAPRIALLPGSRTSELRNHCEILKRLATGLKELYPDAQLRVPVASTLPWADVIAAFANSPITVTEQDSRETMRWADIAVVASGTATLETAIVGTPFCLFYKMSRTTAWLIKNVVRYRRFFGMPNLLHGREVVREFLHENATADALLQECRSLIGDERYRHKMAEDLAQCRSLLGEPGASRRAALQIHQVLRAQPARKASLVSAPV